MKIRLENGDILSVSSIELVGSNLVIVTSESTVEALSTLFGNKNNTETILLFTDSDRCIGSRIGFTNLAGIDFSRGVKTITLMQAEDPINQRLTRLNERISNVSESVTGVEATIDELLTNVIPMMLFGEEEFLEDDEPDEEITEE